MKFCNTQCLAARLLHINSGHFQGSHTLKYSSEFFCFIRVSKQRRVSNSTQFILEASKRLRMTFKTTYGIKPIQNFCGISPRDTSLMHYCTLHACCRLPFLEAWLQLDQLRGCIQHPGKTVLWKQVLLGLKQGTKLLFDYEKDFCEMLIQRRNKCWIWPKCLVLAVKPLYTTGVC